MPFIPAGANASAQMKPLIEERRSLSLGSLVGFFFPDQNFDLLGQQALIEEPRRAASTLAFRSVCWLMLTVTFCLGIGAKGSQHVS